MTIATVTIGLASIGPSKEQITRIVFYRPGVPLSFLLSQAAQWLERNPGHRIVDATVNLDAEYGDTVALYIEEQLN